MERNNKKEIIYFEYGSYYVEEETEILIAKNVA